MVVTERERVIRKALVRHYWPIVKRGIQSVRGDDTDGFAVTLLKKPYPYSGAERYEAVGSELANRVGRILLWPTVQSFKTIILRGDSTIKFMHVVLRVLKHQPRLDKEKGRMKVIEIS